MEEFFKEAYKLWGYARRKNDRKTIALKIKRILELYETMIPAEYGFTFTSELAEMCGTNPESSSYQYLDWLLARGDLGELIADGLMDMMNIHISGKSVSYMMVRKVVNYFVAIGYKHHINIYAYAMNDYKFDKDCDY